MPSARPARCTAFVGTRRLASGPVLQVALAAREHVARRREAGRLVIFDDETGRAVDLELDGTHEEVRARFADADADSLTGEPRRGPGRPRLGVVAKEVTLLPRHWAWLSAQRGGASAALRRLVDEARKTGGERDRVRRAQDATYRFISAMAGNLAGFEETARALYRGDAERFDEETRSWPADVREHARKLAGPAFGRLRSRA